VNLHNNQLGQVLTS